ncbi:MAG TPA: hypothetical protein VFF21_10105 [Flavobacteriaceae bacterium]|nr:hypothetical protein [Flavobacteriaceae bacterium]
MGFDYIIGDPRDRALSAANYYCSPYMKKYYPRIETQPEEFLEKNFDQLIINWVWHVFDYLKNSKDLNIQILFFESLVSNFS